MMGNSTDRLPKIRSCKVSSCRPRRTSPIWIYDSHAEVTASYSLSKAQVDPPLIRNSEIREHCFGPNSVRLKWDIKELRRAKTVREEISAIFGGKKVELRQTGRAVTPFGGLAVFGEFLRRVGFAEQVREAMPFELKSPNAIPAVETYTAFVISVVIGARRFAQAGLLKTDQALQRVIGIRRFPTDDTIRNLFKRFSQGAVVRFHSVLWGWQLERLEPRAEGWSLDLDSVVFERYGRQQGARKGHNPKETWMVESSSVAGGVSGVPFYSARLAAQWQLRSGAGGSGATQASPRAARSSRDRSSAPPQACH